MRSRNLQRRLRESALVVAAVLLLAAPSFAATFNLRAAQDNVTMPDGAVIPVWGFACESATPPASCPNPGVVTVPGPALNVPSGDTSLTINLSNELPDNVSIVIAGQKTDMAPVKFADPQGRQRARSFTAETAPGDTGVYTWTGLKPGTFLYQSGTHPAVQVQMGLYGALKVHPAAAGQAYDDPSTAYNAEATLLYSEIDPGLHQAVDNGCYGTPPCPTSTMDYMPEYFLINGQPFDGAPGALLTASAGDNVLIRFLNAGLRSHVPTLLGAYLKLIAEDGNLYPYPKAQYSALLAAGKTIDALFKPDCADTFKLYDHTLHLTTGALPGGGGMLAYLDVGGTTCAVGTPPPLPPVASSQAVSTNEDNAIPITLVASDANGDPVTGYTVAPPANGALSGTAPNLTYTPNLDYFGPDSFTFQATAGGNNSNVATVSITVNPVNDPPIFTKGPDKTVTQPAGAQTVPNWATGISAGPVNESGQTVSFLVTNNNNALFSAQPAVSSTGTLTYTPAAGASGSATVTVQAKDNGGTANGGADTSAPQTFTITVNPAPASKHVGDLDWTATNVNNTTWQAQVTITVHNQNHQPVQGVIVSRSWTPAGSGGGPNNTTTCTTNAAGQCTLGRRFPRTAASATFAVTNLTGLGGTYTPAANHDPDVGAQASTGTSITVPRPQ